jgi:tetratricopeptide (TPR) repeat protein
MSEEQVNWEELAALAEKLSQSGLSPGSVSQTEWQKIETALNKLCASQDWAGIVRLRNIFDPLIARDSVTVFPLFKRLSQEAITAAAISGDKTELAHTLDAEGHNLHRQGYHREAIEAFEKSAGLYRELGETFRALESFYMTALCHRAVENQRQARLVLEEVLRQVDKDDLWRANPLQVLAWLVQDEGRLPETEALLRQALQLYCQSPNTDIQIVGALADLAEVVGLQGHTIEAQSLFEEGLTILKAYEGQYDRQEARTKLKLAELLIREGKYETALCLLDQADDKIRRYGHYYDLLWRIETARSFAFFRQKKWGSAIRKMRMALYYRRQIGLSNTVFAKQLIRRAQLGIGLPR